MPKHNCLLEVDNCFSTPSLQRPLELGENMAIDIYNISDEERQEAGISDGLLRIAVGFESMKDIQNDLESGLCLI